MRIRDYLSLGQESVLDSASQSEPLLVSAGAGIGGTSIGIAEEESSTTTTRISRTARPSSIEIIFKASHPIKCLMHLTRLTPPEEHIPALSVGLGMEELRGAIASEGGRVLEVCRIDEPVVGGVPAQRERAGRG